MKKFCYLACIALLLILSGFLGVKTYQAEAVEYPIKPIELVVGYSAGGGTYLSAQLLLADAEEYLGQPLQISCKPGAGGAIGASYVANSKTDGYTLLYSTLSLSIAPHLNEETGYKKDDLVGVAQCVSTQSTIVINAESPWNNVDELVTWIKGHPGEFTWGFPGVGSSLHILGSNVWHVLGVADEVKALPFKGSAESTAALLGGHISAISTFTPQILELVRAGKFKVIGVCGENRIEGLPDAPTFKEQGYPILLTSWRGVFAPKDTPKEILEMLDKSLGELIQKPAYKERAKVIGEPVVYKNSEQFTKMYQEQGDLIKGIIEKLGLSK